MLFLGRRLSFVAFNPEQAVNVLVPVVTERLHLQP